MSYRYLLAITLPNGLVESRSILEWEECFRRDLLLDNDSTLENYEQVAEILAVQMFSTGTYYADYSLYKDVTITTAVKEGEGLCPGCKTCMQQQ